MSRKNIKGPPLASELGPEPGQKRRARGRIAPDFLVIFVEQVLRPSLDGQRANAPAVSAAKPQCRPRRPASAQGEKLNDRTHGLGAVQGGVWTAHDFYAAYAKRGDVGKVKRPPTEVRFDPVDQQ